MRSLAFREAHNTKKQPFHEGPVDSRVKGRVYSVPRFNGWPDKRKVKFLRNLAETYGRDPQIRDFVITRVIGSTAQRDYRAQAAAILAWVQSNIRYVNEPDEIIQSPWQTIRLGYGDCDDASVLIGAMAESIALPWRFALSGTRRRDGTRVRWIEGERMPSGVVFAHIYTYLGWPPFRPKTWAAAEGTVPGAALGQDVAMQMGGAVMPEMSGLGDVSDTVVDRRPKHPIFMLADWIPLRDVVASVVTAIIVTYIVDYGVFRPRRRR